MEIKPFESTLEPLTAEPSVSSNGAILMKKIAEDSSLEGMEVNGEKLLNKTKLFLIAQACNELNRVIKLTNLLDTLENKFIETVTTKLEDNPNNLSLITSTMEVITESLNRSNALITQVLKDEKLSSVIINTTNIITPSGDSRSVMTADSRDAVRNWASSFLAQLNHIEESELGGSEKLVDIISEESVESEQKS